VIFPAATSLLNTLERDPSMRFMPAASAASLVSTATTW
jgi:hypothetical protein